MTNAQQGATVKITFHNDGTFYLINRPNPRPGIDLTKDVEGNWTKNGDIIYLSAPGRTDVGVMEILSQDHDNLVIHIQGEPNDEINYFRRD